jgi:hypothetical protein
MPKFNGGGFIRGGWSSSGTGGYSGRTGNNFFGKGQDKNMSGGGTGNHRGKPSGKPASNKGGGKRGK